MVTILLPHRSKLYERDELMQYQSLSFRFGLMKADGVDIKTIQELLRHFELQVTADTYTQAVTPMERAPPQLSTPDIGLATRPHVQSSQNGLRSVQMLRLHARP